MPARTATVVIAPANAVLGWLDVGGKRVDLASQTMNIGRDPGSEVAISDPAVSYTHAQITRLGNDLYLRDVGSRNGTYVNAQLVSVPHLLREGDVIHVGTTDVTFHGTAATAAPVAPAPAPAYPSGPPAAPQPPVVPGTAPQQPVAPAPPGAAIPQAPPVPAPGPPQPPTAPMAPVAPGAPLAPPAAPAMAPQPPVAPSPGEPLPGPAGPTASAPAGPKLVVVVGPTVGLSFALLGDSIRVGRDQSSGIVIRDQTVSRQHAVLERRGDQWTVTDLGSTNGTEVAGTRIPPQQPTPLVPGSRVGFGDVECVFEVS